MKKKGQELAIRTIKELTKRNIDVKLDFLGDGPLRKILETLVANLDLSSNVFFHGNVDYPEEYLSRAFCYIHTVKYEPFGLVLIEAMAAGLPVICADGKGNRELIEDGKNGFMIWERSPEKIAAKIELLFEDNTLRTNMGNYAKEYSKQFDIKNYCDKLISLYNEAISSTK